MDIITGIASLLIIIGALNWGLIGICNFNLVEYIFKKKYARIIYILVGIAGLYSILYLIF